MFQVVQKLKRVKFVLKELNKNGFLEFRVANLQGHKKMVEEQKHMHLHPGNKEIAEQELQTVREYKGKHGIYVAFF